MWAGSRAAEICSQQLLNDSHQHPTQQGNIKMSFLLCYATKIQAWQQTDMHGVPMLLHGVTIPADHWRLLRLRGQVV